MTAADDAWRHGLDLDDWLTIAELSEALGVPQVTLRGWVKRGHVTAVYLSDAGHQMYRLGEAHAVHLRIKQRGTKMPDAAKVWGWTRRPGQPWTFAGLPPRDAANR